MDRSHTAARLTAGLLVILMAVAAMQWHIQGPPMPERPTGQTVWLVFLFAAPFALAGLALLNVRWSLIGGVIYGTIGLALDISTIVQELSQAGDYTQRFWFSAVTGFVNTLVIMVAGHGFLDVGPTSSLRAAPPPNPRSPSSTE
ncbi:hypothetical protein [Candidatus Nitrospira bockiana]